MVNESDSGFAHMEVMPPRAMTAEEKQVFERGEHLRARVDGFMESLSVDERDSLHKASRDSSLRDILGAVFSLSPSKLFKALGILVPAEGIATAPKQQEIPSPGLSAKPFEGRGIS